MDRSPHKRKPNIIYKNTKSSRPPSSNKIILQKPHHSDLESTLLLFLPSNTYLDFFSSPDGLQKASKKEEFHDADSLDSLDSEEYNLQKARELAENKKVKTDTERFLTQMAQKTAVYNKLFKTRTPFFLQPQEKEGKPPKSPKMTILEEIKVIVKSRSSQRGSLKPNRRKSTIPKQ